MSMIVIMSEPALHMQIQRVLLQCFVLTELPDLILF